MAKRFGSVSVYQRPARGYPLERWFWKVTGADGEVLARSNRTGGFATMVLAKQHVQRVVSIASEAAATWRRK